MKLSANTVNRYVREGMAGQEPLKRGYEGILPAYAFKLLVMAG